LHQNIEHAQQIIANSRSDRSQMASKHNKLIS